LARNLRQEFFVQTVQNVKTRCIKNSSIAADFLLIHKQPLLDHDWNYKYPLDLASVTAASATKPGTPSRSEALQSIMRKRKFFLSPSQGDCNDVRHESMAAAWFILPPVNVSASKESSASSAKARSLTSSAFVANGMMEKDDSTKIIADALIMD
jgi:hypothetical protein